MLRPHPAYSIGTTNTEARRVTIARQAHTTEQLNTLVLRPPPARIGCGEILFHHNSAVMMPDGFEAKNWPERPYETIVESEMTHMKRYFPHAWKAINDLDYEPDEHPEQPRRGALGVLVAALAFLKVNPRHRLLAAGHTDTSGSEEQNHALSALRAEGAIALLENDRARWSKIATLRSKVEDYQRILEYVACTRGFSCRPGRIDGVADVETRRAIREFQQSYNEAYSGNLDVNGVIEAPTWAAFFDLYREDMANMLGIDVTALDGYVARRYVEDERRWVACGERLPVSAAGQDGLVSLINRRVELLFFHESDLPTQSCHQLDACLAKSPLGRCSVYAPGRYRYIPLEPLLEPGLSLKKADGSFEIIERGREESESDVLEVIALQEAGGSSGPIAWEFLDAFAAAFPEGDFYDTPVPYDGASDE